MTKYVAAAIGPPTTTNRCPELFVTVVGVKAAAPHLVIAGALAADVVGGAGEDQVGFDVVEGIAVVTEPQPAVLGGHANKNITCVLSAILALARALPAGGLAPGNTASQKC